MAQAQPVQVRSISCPNCGGPVQLRGFAHTLSVVCPQCQTVLDTSTPEVRILEEAQTRQRITPAIPLGSRGAIQGTTYEVIGFQVREVSSEGETWSWREYLLFNPFKGFRYLTEYNGHWNFVKPETAVPESMRQTGRFPLKFRGHTYLLFDRMDARTSFVLGEFPWRVHVGDLVACRDYVAPPSMLSAESTDEETTWSLAEYMKGRDVWSAFKLPGSPPAVTGIFANQPSPYHGVGGTWKTWLWLNVALLLLLIGFAIAMPSQQVFHDEYEFAKGANAEPSFVTPYFTLAGRDANVQVKIHTNLNNSWAYFNLALINAQSGHAYDFGREVSNYSDEGSPNNSVIIPGIPSGQYYLRVEPELDPSLATLRYDLTLRRNVPNYTLFLIAAILLLVPAIIRSAHATSFEAARWRESDYGSAIVSATKGGD